MTSTPDPHSSEGLATLYERAASGWQAGIAKLGYPAAYEALITHGAARLPADARVLDAGCGSGAMAVAYDTVIRRVRQFDLLDSSGAMLTAAKAALGGTTAPVRLIEDRLGSDKVPAGTYDVLLCAHVVEHVPDPADALAWLNTRLRPGGVAIFAISRPHWCTALLRWKWGHKAWRSDQVVRMLQGAGFAAVTVHGHPAGPPKRTSCGYIAIRPGDA